MLSRSLDVTLAGSVDPVERDPNLYDAVPHYATLDEVDLATYDAVIVSLPHDLAVATAGAVLEAGRPVLVEKPLGLTGADARALAAAANRLQQPSFVGYNYRFLPHVRDLIAAVRSGSIGRLRSVDMTIGHGGHPGSAEGWKLAPERAGGGVLLDPGVHLLDLLLQMAPDAEPAFACGTRGFWGTGIEEDLVLAFTAPGMLATLRVSHIRWVNEMRIEVIGDDGYALAAGRGGNYGPMTLRTGRRWGWHEDPAGRTQRETEARSDHGTTNDSLDVETEAVVRRWLGEPGPQPGPQPATAAEGATVTLLVEDLYSRMVEP